MVEKFLVEYKRKSEGLNFVQSGSIVWVCAIFAVAIMKA